MTHACQACGAANPAGNRFCGGCGAKLGDGAPAAGAGEERRWASVLFADLSGFTSMAERMDPEDVKTLAAHCTGRMSEIVTGFGGTVINLMGDAVLAVFGAPVTHEDDAERAVRAALAIRDCAYGGDNPAPETIRVHVGVNTGEVMAGSVGSERHRSYTVMGDTVNTAARLMSAAAAGSVLVGEETWRATQRPVRYRELAPLTVKGKQAPVRAWEALGAGTVSGTRRVGIGPLVGRAEELGVLLAVWGKVAREARPHLVTVLGDAGIGKSRLMAEFEARLGRDATCVHGRCLPYGETLGYGAMAVAFREAAGVGADDSAEIARRKLGECVAAAVEATEAPELARHVALLAGLDRPADREAGLPDQKTLHVAARRFLEALARRRPLCVVLDDLHLADAALFDLVESVASRAHDAPLCFLIQARPELLQRRPGWGGGMRSATSLSLEPLDERARRELVDSLLHGHPAARSAADQIVRAAAGNPLFAEELVATVAERGTLAAAPTALRGLIGARLDALPAPEREVLRLASVMGEQFWLGGLRALGLGADAAARLEALADRDLVRGRPASQFPGDREYAFKHALIRDEAYATLPRADRRTLHGRVADWIAGTAGDRAGEFADRLAHHALEAGQDARALQALVEAADRTRRAAARREEAALLERAIGIAERTGPADLVLRLRIRRGAAFAAIGASREACAAFEAALALVPPEDATTRADVLVQLATVTHWMQDPVRTRAYGTEALALAERVGREDLAAGALAALGGADSAQGDVERSLQRYREAVARAGDRPSVASVAALPFLSQGLYWAGHIEEALVQAERGVASARSVQDATNTLMSLQQRAIALAGRGRYAEAAQAFDEARRFGREYGIGPLTARATSMSAGWRLDVGDFAGAEAAAREARDLARSLDFMPPLVSAGLDLLFVHTRRGEVANAEALVPEVAEAAARGAGWHGWLWRLRLATAQAELALARGDHEAARGFAEAALAQGHEKRRPKYEILALQHRATVLAATGRTVDAIADLRQATALARRVGDPALFLAAASPLVTLAGDDALAAETRATTAAVTAALPDEDVRARFLAWQLAARNRRR